MLSTYRVCKIYIKLDAVVTSRGGWAYRSLPVGVDVTRQGTWLLQGDHLSSFARESVLCSDVTNNHPGLSLSEVSVLVINHRMSLLICSIFVLFFVFCFTVPCINHHLGHFSQCIRQEEDSSSTLLAPSPLLRSEEWFQFSSILPESVHPQVTMQPGDTTTQDALLKSQPFSLNCVFLDHQEALTELLRPCLQRADPVRSHCRLQVCISIERSG